MSVYQPGSCGCCGGSPPCQWGCVNDSACFSGKVDIQLCTTDGKHYTGTNSSAGISVTFTYDPTNGSTFSYTCAGGGHTHNFAVGATMPLLYNDPSGWSIAAGTLNGCGGNAQTCPACLNSVAANEYLLEFSAGFAAKITCPADPTGTTEGIQCNHGTCHTFVSGIYQDVPVPGLDGAYYMSVGSTCTYDGSRNNSPGMVYGCCDQFNTSRVIMSLSFTSDVGGYHVVVAMQSGGLQLIGKWQLTQATPFDCYLFNGTNIPWVSQDAAGPCDSSGATCTLSLI